MKPGTPSLQSIRLLDQVRERIQYMHYSLKTKKAYLYWIRFYIRWSATQSGGMRHPRDMSVAEIEAFCPRSPTSASYPPTDTFRHLVRCCFCTAKCWAKIYLGSTTLGDSSRPSAFRRY